MAKVLRHGLMGNATKVSTEMGNNMESDGIQREKANLLAKVNGQKVKGSDGQMILIVKVAATLIVYEEY